MKYKRIHLPFVVDNTNTNELILITPKDGDDTKNVDELISQLVEDGWQIVSTSPIISSKEFKNSVVFPFTTGIEVFLVKNDDVIELEAEDKNIKTLPPFANEPLKSGKFQMPDCALNDEIKFKFFKYWLPKWGWDGTEENQELDESGRSIRTYLLSLGLISNEPNSNRFVANTFDSRKLYLSKKITEAYECIDDTSNESKIKLFDAFNAIQLWGGKMGKGFYIENTDTNLEDRLQQGELIKEKWIDNIDAIYRGIVKSMKYNKFTIINLEDGFNDINGMGVAFATKHLNFWSTKCKIDVLPIYDSFIYQILFAKVSGNPNWRYYNKYVESLKELKMKFDNKFTITDLERALFAYCKIIGVKYNNVVIKEHENEETLLVNQFINTRLLKE